MDISDVDKGAAPGRPSPLRPAPLLAALGGLVAGAVGVATASLIAGLFRQFRSPVLDVGDRVIDAAPIWLKDIAISLFGTNDKVALLVGIGVLLALYAVVVGSLALRHRLLWGLVGFGAFGLVGALSAVGARTETSGLVVVPSVVGAAAGSAALLALARTGGTSAASAVSAAPRSLRRRFLVRLGALGLYAVVGAAVGQRLERRFTADASRELAAALTGTAGPPAIPAGAQAINAAPFFTPNADFYRIDTALTIPQVPVDSWQLKVTGLVDEPLQLSYDELIDVGIVESDITLTCVSNLVGGDLTGTARWTGVRLDRLLDLAGMASSADQIVGRSVDGYSCGFPVAALDGRDALVAIGMNGEPLPLAHGFPARLIVPGIYGYASATKWLTEIELTTFADFDQYWVPRGYASRAPIKMQTRIDAPRGLDRIGPGRFAIGGTAWAQPIGISQVELSIDDGPWIPADMAAEVNTSTWRQWSYIWNAAPGRHTITARSIDNSGNVQTAERADPLPDGVTGHHTVVVLVDEA